MKTIHVRPTRPTERFNEKDLFIAWFDGEAAGTMAETELKTIEKLLNDHEPNPYPKKGIDKLKKL